MRPGLELRERLLAEILEREAVGEADLWSRGGPVAVRASRFEGLPDFYPVYRWNDVYAPSLATLLLIKGSYRPNPDAAAAACADDFLYYPGNDTIDADITRVGGPPRLDTESPIRDAESYAQAWVDAVREDVAEQEARAPGGTNVILAGGKDSLNLLLLPWRNPTLVVSAQPNTPLVERFVAENDLDLEVRELRDPEEPDVLEQEILENGCRADLRHYRWGADLRALGRELGDGTVFWKGQVADALTTPYWKTLTHPPGGIATFVRKVYARGDRVLPGAVRRALADGFLVPSLMETLWHRCAMFQGSHMGVIRGVTGRLVLSAYHGARTRQVWRRVRFAEAVDRDVRPAMGALLRGAPVRYPAANPSPPPSAFRAGLCRPERFAERVASLGLSIEAG
jgi:hypothetical protein